MTIFVDLSRQGAALITAWLKVQAVGECRDLQALPTD
jgi:hypothetical protein